MSYPRDMRGYGAQTPKFEWPGGAKLAISLVVNYEEGGENCLLHGDAMSEAFLSEIIGAQNWPAQRHANMESLYEYGARAGFWRIYRLLEEMKLPATVYGVATALMRSPEQVEAMKAANWEIASHGLKWIEYKDFAPEEERAHMREAVTLHRAVTGQAPRGWYTGRSSENTLNLASEMGIFDYLSDAYADDLPYWHHHKGRDQLIIPYTLDANDMRFTTAQGFTTSDDFFHYLRDGFDALMREGRAGHPKMMSVGLHCRIIGHPGRIEGLRRFLDYARKQDHVWFARRVEIAEFWRERFPAQRANTRPSAMTRDEFIAEFGSIFEHSPWIAARAFDAGLGGANDSGLGLFAALCREFRLSSDEERLGVLNAHPDLAGKIASARLLTEDSASEQASAGLDTLSEDEKQAFSTKNAAYMARFGFPFIIAVRDYRKAEILAQFDERLANSAETEFQTACQMVERIAQLRIKERLS